MPGLMVLTIPHALLLLSLSPHTALALLSACTASPACTASALSILTQYSCPHNSHHPHKLLLPSLSSCTVPPSPLTAQTLPAPATSTAALLLLSVLAALCAEPPAPQPHQWVVSIQEHPV
eukprot:1152332-Pelagomonas_calceolata.AAC.1